MKLAVVLDYGAGNIGSISHFLRSFEFTVVVTNDSEKISEADLLVLPGVGSFGPAKFTLDLTGACSAINERFRLGKPILGICLGFQLMTLSSEEANGVSGLGLINAVTRRLTEGPVIGWHKCSNQSGPNGFHEEYYFNHAYGVFELIKHEDVLFSGKDNYIAYARIGNVIGTQFHPEKSQQAGTDFFAKLISTFWQELA
jgi:glutamine amidotransferase